MIAILSNTSTFADIADAKIKDTIKILSLCRNPNNLTIRDPFNSAGLIIGNIQSGKTGSMEAVSCLARDNGYKAVKYEKIVARIIDKLI